jgi:hypothetical protein
MTHTWPCLPTHYSLYYPHFAGGQSLSPTHFTPHTHRLTLLHTHTGGQRLSLGAHHRLGTVGYLVWHYCWMRRRNHCQCSQCYRQICGLDLRHSCCAQGVCVCVCLCVCVRACVRVCVRACVYVYFLPLLVLFLFFGVFFSKTALMTYLFSPRLP